ncbi:MAG: carbamoyltransferase C-terminal domain-containing protein, partial [Kiritimatiellae bacterium]|nr:carbamoyltransferase C-terminal domain-containing protein [Kiritimatiellia bacterium]
QPAAGDAGGALGAALCVWHQVMEKERTPVPGDAMKGSYLGPVFSDEEIAAFLEAKGYPARRCTEEEWAPEIARLIEERHVIGLCHGRMEFGPRALGNRSIIGDARSPEMQSVMNLKIKYRESFRPFAPSCLEERVSEYFELEEPSPYMLLVAPVRASRRQNVESGRPIRERINQVRSDVPAITHVDYSARVQTVSEEVNKPYYDIIREFEKRTGYGIIINTSFNVRGEPIVCTPEDAYRCFMRTEMDTLVLGSFLLDKKEQPAWSEAKDWRDEFALD